jgi:hypothetical protein
MLTFVFAFAERERDIGVIRTKAALEAKRVREGKLIINGSPYHKNKVCLKFANKRSAEFRKGQYSKAHSKAILIAKQLRGQDGYTMQKIADSLNNFGFKTTEGCSFRRQQVSRLLSAT